jgi:hypothetical protein
MVVRTPLPDVRWTIVYALFGGARHGRLQFGGSFALNYATIVAANA